MEEKKEKIVIFATHGGEDPERASLPFVMGNAALTLDVEVTMILQGTGVTIAKKGCYEHIFAAGFEPLKKMVDTFVEFGGKILVCIPCLEERQITGEMLIDAAELGKAGKVVTESLSANAILNY